MDEEGEALRLASTALEANAGGWASGPAACAAARPGRMCMPCAGAGVLAPVAVLP